MMLFTADAGRISHPDVISSCSNILDETILTQSSLRLVVVPYIKFSFLM